MSKTRIYYDGPRPAIVYKEKTYGFWKFMLDIFMTVVTFGVWLIWIVIREIKNS